MVAAAGSARIGCFSRLTTPSGARPHRPTVSVFNNCSAVSKYAASSTSTGFHVLNMADLTLGRALIGDIVAPQQNAQQQPTAQMRNVGLANEALQARNTDDWESDLNSLWDDAVNSSLSRLPTRNVSQAGADEPLAPVPLHVAPSRNGAPTPGKASPGRS
jgi:hypothetical protein